MKRFLIVAALAVVNLCSTDVHAQGTQSKPSTKKLYLDVHHLGAGKVKLADLHGAHQKDLGVQKKHNVEILKFWFDEAKGDVYCLAEGPSADALTETHKEAHGLVPDKVYEVPASKKQALKGMKNLYLDLHEFGPGKVPPAAAVADAHKKDLAVQGKYGVNIVDYWINEKEGTIVCLAQAPDSAALTKTHKEAHGLVPARVTKINEGH
jgi:hypothetical protein